MSSQDFIRRHLIKRSLLSFMLYPLSLVWGIVQRYRRDFWKMKGGKRANVKIISIGNITAGGSGKTPFTIWLAKQLQQQGRKLAVSHRGYKGDFEYKNSIISDREKIFPEAAKAGDEALLLAEKLAGIPVCAGSDRWQSIQLLEDKYPDLEMIILDDSFQHLKVHHDLDIVILKTVSPLGNGFVLPAGILREPVSVLKDADLIILNGKGDFPDFLRNYKKITRQGDYRVSGIFLNNKIEIGLSELAAGKLGIVSGIADPASLENTLSDLNLSYNFHLKFPDHYHYSANSDRVTIEKQIKTSQVDYIITTEKDYTKLRFLSLSIPVAVLRIEFYLLKDDFSDFSALL
ncbi:MAG: tetraacyldisaccharide 4'-kinase [Candidatus Cloacimonetes bacterium]|nr:tetraacyldisaccharide 4'-kinase [Candidatus Cloacimonadota bacterium]